MKIHFSHLKRFLKEDLDINNLSNKLFQLGHENEINGDIIDIEITPNRGDCLSLLGISRDVNVLCETNNDIPVFSDEIDEFNFNFKNNACEKCPNIYFLNISVKSLPDTYISEIESYFSDLDLKKNNFFTDISNYVAYEMGQPTHCYDADTIEGEITLNEEKVDEEFLTLLDQKIELVDSNLIFRDEKGIINLAGIMGGKRTACNSSTKEAIVESAFFNPESIIGKSIKYNINSDAAHRFERGVDPLLQETALRRFIYLVNQHTEIESLKLYKNKGPQFRFIELDTDLNKVNNILGTNIKEEKYINILNRLGFSSKKNITVPSYRFDIKHQNDIAEEIARAIGYDQIKAIKYEPFKNNIAKKNIENRLKQFLKDNGFYEVINMPFTKKSNKDSIIIDNPLDLNRDSFRTELVTSLINNLDYNERRQKDSIKLFEISDIYSCKEKLITEKKISLVVSGIQGHNHKEFSKKLNRNYLLELFNKLEFDAENFITAFSRENINSKVKNPIFVFDTNYEEFIQKVNLEDIKPNQEMSFNLYEDISEYPSTTKDISFSLKNINDLKKIERVILGYKSKNLKDSFIFDFYNNVKDEVIKVGFRFVFQSKSRTLEEKDIKNEINSIISLSYGIDGVHIPGLE